MPGVNPPEYLLAAVPGEYPTGATPAFLHNDEAVIEVAHSAWDSPEHARDYGIVGCVEPCSVGRHYGHTAAVLLNLMAVLELTP